MNIDVFMEAKELYERYRMCEVLMADMSSPESSKGYAYKERLAKFVAAFQSQFMEFLQKQMETTGMAFEELSDCKCGDTPDNPETPETPVEPENPDENGGTVEPDAGE